MSLTGNFAALDRFKRKLETMEDAIDGAVDKMAKQGSALTQASFGKRTDPYGKKWQAWSARYAARAGKRGGPKALLERTAKLRRSIRVRRKGRGIVWSFGAEYGKYHQDGANGVRRPFIPDSRGLPPKWLRMFKRTMKEALRAHFR